MASTAPLVRNPIGSSIQPRQLRVAPLRVPLVTKLVGANLLVVAILLAAWHARGGAMDDVVTIVVLAVVLLQAALVLAALQPIRDLEQVVARVWRGDFRARVERSSLADDAVLRVGSMFNLLLDGLDTDRARMQALAREIIAVGDRERAAISRELHDSTAQDIAALLLQLSAAARDTDDEALAARLREVRNSAEAILEHVRQLSQSVHPGVLDGLGLDAALRKLAREQSDGTGIDVVVDLKADEAAERLAGDVEASLYRIAHEAVRNAVRHASPRRIRIDLFRTPADVTLEIHDDGTGFDPAGTDRPGRVGLLCMRERAALVAGSLVIRTARGNGTTVSVTVPVGALRPAVSVEKQ